MKINYALNESDRQQLIGILQASQSPVLSGLDIACKFNSNRNLTTSHKDYRRVMRRLWELEKLGTVQCYYMGGSNQRVWWLKERMK